MSHDQVVGVTCPGYWCHMTRLLVSHDQVVLSHAQVVGVSLRECISKDSRLWVVCQALDSVFDVFGDDNCPPSVFVDVALMPALQKLASTFKARVSHHELVQ